MKLLIRSLVEGILSPAFIIIIFFVALYARFFSGVKDENPRLVWGDAPIINNKYWSDAMLKNGYSSIVYTDGYCSSINKRKDYGRLLSEIYGYILVRTGIARYLAFIECLIKFDVFIISFTGFFLGKTILWRMEYFFFKLADKKIVVIPFGLDSYIYNRVKSTSLLHGLLMSIPRFARKQNKITNHVEYWCEHADVIIPGIMGPDGFGRWDVLIPSALFISEDEFKISTRMSFADGVSDTVFIAHAPNHRGFKGTEFIVEAVSQLVKEGLKVELVLIENIQNEEVKRIFQEDVDILVEQIIATGHALTSLEGMASGLPAISNLEDDSYILPFRRWTYFNECPLVSASPETIKETLRKLIMNPSLRHELGRAGRQYVEKYHGTDSTQFLFESVIEYLYGQRDSLINLYHPLLGEYNKTKPLIKHPLVKNHINAEKVI